MSLSSVALGLLLARIGAFVAVMPLVSARAPRSVRAGMVLVFAAFYVGPASADLVAAPPGSVREVDPIGYGLILARESLIGAAMGFAFGLFLPPGRAGRVRKGSPRAPEPDRGIPGRDCGGRAGHR